MQSVGFWGAFPSTKQSVVRFLKGSKKASHHGAHKQSTEQVCSQVAFDSTAASRGEKNYRVTAGTVGLSTLPQIHRGSKAVGSVARSER